MYGSLRDIILVFLCILACALTANRMLVGVMVLLLGFSVMYGLEQKQVGVTLGKKIFGWLASVFFFVGLVSVVVIDGRFADAFIGGDGGVQYGGMAFNTAGRANIWFQILADTSISPLFGSGHDIPLALDTERWRHPHNDYLRVYSRGGLIGLAFFCLFFAFLLRSLLRCRVFLIKQPELEVRYRAAVFLLIGVLLMMVTDNTLVYP